MPLILPSAKYIQGSVPEKVSLIYFEPVSIHNGYEWSSDNGQIKVIPAYPALHNDQYSQSQAKRMLINGYFRNNRNLQASTLTLENQPMDDLKVISYSYSGGYKTFKVQLGEHCVDVRDDCIMDAIFNSSIQDGYIKGSYIWANIRSRLRLVRVGSDMHKLIQEYHTKKKLKPLSNKKLEVGGVYQTRAKKRAIFLGLGDTTVFHRNYGKTTSAFDFHSINQKNMMIFFLIDNNKSGEENLEILQDNKLVHQGNYYSTIFYSANKTHSYLEKIGQIQVPDKIFQKIQELAVEEIKDAILRFAGQSPINNGTWKPSEWSLAHYNCALSPLMHLHKKDEEAPKLFDIQKWLNFI